MMLQVCKIGGDVLRGIFDALSDIESAGDNGARPLSKELPRGGNVDLDVVFGAMPCPKFSTHDRQQADFLRCKVAAVERTGIVGLGIQEPREICTESDLNDDDAVVRLSRQCFSKDAYCVRQIGLACDAVLV